MNITKLPIQEQVTHRQSQIIAEPIPEPTVTLLVGLGVAGLAGVARRRKIS